MKGLYATIIRNTARCKVREELECYSLRSHVLRLTMQITPSLEKKTFS